MNKKILSFLISVTLLLTACTSKSSKKKSVEKNLDAVEDLSAKTAYEFNLAYDSKNHQLAGTMKATITNCSGDSLNKVVINDWATTSYYAEKNFPDYAPTDFSNTTITIAGEKIPVVMQRQNNLTSLEADAKKDIPDGETFVFQTDFVIHIPNFEYRYGYSIKDGVERVALGNALPVLALYKNGEWITHSYVSDGESFNSEVADYDVTFTCPPEYEVVMTGIPEVVDSTYHCVENCIRDFTIMLATHHTTYVEDYNGLLITVWGNSDCAADLPKFAEQTKTMMDFYTKLVGPYPYDSIDICLLDLPAGGMEYAELVICNTEQAFETPQALAHELGHEWFYLSVGNDEFSEPWIDESITSYISILYMESLGYDMTDSYVKKEYEKYYDICGSVSAMTDDKYYRMSAYSYGPTFLRNLNELMGDKAFNAALQEIYNTYIFKQADTQGVLNIFRKHSKKSIEDLICRYFKEK